MLSALQFRAAPTAMQLSDALDTVREMYRKQLRKVTLRKDFMHPIRIRELASAAGMSVSVFHQHFRSLTTLTPLQFQKQLRLIHARNQMLTRGVGITHAASAVGYTSVSQFTREYVRMFDIPPGRDIRRLRDTPLQE